MEAEQWLSESSPQPSKGTLIPLHETHCPTQPNRIVYKQHSVTLSTISCNFGTRSHRHTTTIYSDRTNTRVQTISNTRITVHNLSDITALVSPLGHNALGQLTRGKMSFSFSYGVNATRRTKHSSNGVFGVQRLTRYRRFGAKRNQSSSLSFFEWHHVLNLEREPER